MLCLEQMEQGVTRTLNVKNRSVSPRQLLGAPLHRGPRGVTAPPRTCSKG